MKRKKISMKWKCFAYLLIFTVVLLIVLWLFQTVYLGVFYKQIKKNELKSAMNNLISSMETEDYNQSVQAISQSYDISVLIFDTEGNTLYATEYMPSRFLYETEFEIWYQKAKENGGEYAENRKWSPGDPRPQSDEPANTEYYAPENVLEFQKLKKMPGMPEPNIEETVIWVRIVLDAAGGEWVYLLNSVITPVDATVHTLRIQLICISAVMLILSLLIAWILAKSISRSIVRVNATAKELAKGNYNVIFEAGDYREIAELSETLNYAAKELGKTEKFQRELIANVSHDLRTPLTMIIAYGEMMRDLPGENTPENIEVIVEEAKRLTTLVNDMMDISKLQAGVMTLEPERYSLTESVEGVVRRFSKMLEPYGYQICFDYQEEAWVKADKEKLHQVIYNLIGNAVNYTGADKKVMVRQLCGEEWIRIEVEDTGEGIPEENLPYVWERYYKVDKNHKRAVTGTGLGLSIVKHILSLHGAEYGVKSTEDKGSIFWFEVRREKIK
ncbi:MAG: HAMP domain-containing histidine kinase [Lachnospiraceae bacterium]|nr:HAMP domain-containing histidine kinase [Lachnospiraceae bacterium]